MLLAAEAAGPDARAAIPDRYRRQRPLESRSGRLPFARGATAADRVA